MKRRLWGVGLIVALLGLFGGAALRAAPAVTSPAASPRAGAAARESEAKSEDIRDIHGPIATPEPRPLWSILVGLGAVVAIVGGIAYFGRRGGRPLAPADRALRALAEARGQPDLDARTFSFAASETVRHYVEEAFAVRAAHRTTEELLGDLMRDASPVSAHRAELGEFLRWCDLAKFAGWSLSPTERASMLASAEAFVRATSASLEPAGQPLRVLHPPRQGTSA